MTTKQDVLEFIKKIVEEVKDYSGEITYETTFEQLELDSLDYVQTHLEAKKKFGVELSADLFAEQIRTVGQLCDYVADLLNATTAPA